MKDYYTYYLDLFDHTTDHKVYASYRETLWDNRTDPPDIREAKFKALDQLIREFKAKRKSVNKSQ